MNQYQTTSLLKIRLRRPVYAMCMYMKYTSTLICCKVMLLFLVIRALIQYIESDEQNDWKGYTYAVALFLSAVLNVFGFHHMVFTTLTSGLRIRTTLTTAIYRKVCATRDLTNLLNYRWWGNIFQSYGE